MRYKYTKEEIYQSHQLRKSMWLLLSKTIFKIQEYENYYKDLLDLEYPEYYHKIIENDVKRTLEQKTPMSP